MLKWLLLLILMPSACFGQDWFPNGATWHFSFDPELLDNVGYIRMEVTGDTTVAGVNTKKIARYKMGYNNITQEEFDGPDGYTFAHEADGIIWTYDPIQDEFDTLYNMNAVPGMRWGMAKLPGFGLWICSPSSYYEVTDIGTTEINGVMLRWISVDIHMFQGSDPGYVLQDTILQRRGTLGYLLPHEPCIAGGDDGGPLRCYTDNEIGIQIESVACDYVVGLSESIEHLYNALDIYPNPAEAQVTFEVDMNVAGPDADLIVRDVLGRKVYHTKLTDHNPTIFLDLQAIPRGSYSVALTNWSGVVQVEKLIVR